MTDHSTGAFFMKSRIGSLVVRCLHIDGNIQYRHFKIFLKDIAITINALDLKTKTVYPHFSESKCSFVMLNSFRQKLVRYLPEQNAHD